MAESKLADSTEARSTKIVIFGKSGTGKSALGNMILGSKKFESTNAPGSVTDKVQLESVNVDDDVWFVVDTPGIWDPTNAELKTELEKCFVFLSPGFHVALYTISISERFTPEDVKVLDLFVSWFGEDVYKYLQIVFTKGDQLEGEFDTYLSKCGKDLQTVIDKCKYKPIAVCSCGNDKGICTKNWAEVKDAIDTIKAENSNGHYTSDDFMEIEAKLQEIDIISLRKIKEREDKKFRIKLEKVLLDEFPPLSISSKLEKVKRQQRINELTLEHEHNLQNLARVESLEQYNKYVKNMMVAGVVVGAMAGGTVGGPVGAAGGAYVGAHIFATIAFVSSAIVNKKKKQQK